MTTEERLRWAGAVLALRKRLKLTQTQMAEKVGVSFTTVNRWEKEHHEPTYTAMREVLRLAQTLEKTNAS